MHCVIRHFSWPWKCTANHNLNQDASFVDLAATSDKAKVYFTLNASPDVWDFNTYHPKLWNPSGGVIARLFTAWVIFKRLTQFAVFLFTPSLSFRAERSAWAQLIIHMYLGYRIFGVYGEGQIRYMHFQGLLFMLTNSKKCTCLSEEFL